MRQALILFAMFLMFSQLALAQNKTVTGKIISSEDNLGIPGVSVVVVGTTIGVTTDVDGNFTLAVPDSATRLKLSALGMKSQELAIPANNVLNVTMQPDVMKLEEVVVTANAIVREKRSLGYATQQVTSDNLTAGENRNLVGALQGKVAGVNITSLSGAPGSAQRIVIRGGTSIARNNQPIFVVDGVIIDNSNFRTGDDLNNQVDYGSRGNDINPDDIESISVLKGPAAAALYGSQASNGAIMITTKKGRRTQGKAKNEVVFHSNVTFSNVLKLPDFQNKYGQGDLDNVVDDRRENFSWGLPFDGKLRPWGQEINGQQRVKPYEANEDNMKDFFNTGVGYTNSLAFGGGNEKTDYQLSLSSSNTKGIVPSQRYDKYTVHFNGNADLTNKFSSGISLNYSNVSAVHPSGGQRDASIYDQLLQTPRDIPIIDGKNLDDPFNAYNDITGQYGFYGAYTTNPYFVLNNFKNTQNVDRVLGNVTVTYHGWDFLSITNRFGGDIYGDRRYQRWSKYSYEPIDPFYVGNNQIYAGKYSEDLYNFTSWTNDLMFDFNHKFSEDFSGTLLLGYNLRERQWTENNTQTNELGGLGIPGYFNLVNSNGPVAAKSTLDHTRNIGYYADAHFSYKNYLFAGLSGRLDKSSTLPADNNTYFYPGANISFIPSEFFSDTLRENQFNYLKLRASYARVGNDASAYRTANYYTNSDIDGGFGSTKFPFGDVQGYTSGDRLGNPQLKPEFTSELELGADMSFLKDRLSIEFSWYSKRSTDQIIDLPLAPSTGFTQKTINTGELTNKGFEIGARGVPIRAKSGFEMEIYGTYFKNTNEVVSLYQGVEQLTLGGTSRTAIVAQVGHPNGSFYAVDLLTDPNGHVVVDSATGQPLTTPNLVYVGNYQPDWQASLGANFKFKGWQLGILFDCKQGGQFSSRTKDVMDFVGTAVETENREDQIWPGSVYQSTADNGGYVTNDRPYHPYTYYTNRIPDGQHIVDASYVKLREMHLTYTFPAKTLSKTPFGTASLTIFGNNLLIWTPEENHYADPEQNSSGSSNVQGFEFTANPSQRNYGVDLKLSF
jgi:TonB-linked SusC/RagA family outer membrane protein